MPDVGGAGLGGGGRSSSDANYNSDGTDVANNSNQLNQADVLNTEVSGGSKFQSSTTSSDKLSTQSTMEDKLKSISTALDVATGKNATDTADAVSLAGAANTGINVPLHGIEKGPIKAEPMRFGRYAKNSVSPETGYRISEYGRNHQGWNPAKNTMVSSQAAYDVARQTDPGLKHTRFEVDTPAANVQRSYDIKSPDNTLVEIKAGKTVTPDQLAKDINLARTGQAVEYVFTGNPVTGNHGPDDKTIAKLDDAVQKSGGNLSYRVADDVAPTSRQIDAVASAGKFSRITKSAGKVLGPAAVALDVYTIGAAVHKDGGSFGQNTKVAVAETAGGWAGAASVGWVGAQMGAYGGALVGGPVGAAVGGVAGAVVGAISGAISGSWLGGAIVQ